MGIETFLSGRGVDFDTLPHPDTYTASHLAGMLHERGDHVAKTVLLKADEDWILAVMPSSYNLQRDLARSEVGCTQLVLADEEECADVFPDCEPGAIPPFGSLYGIQTWVDSRLAEDEYIVFETESHHDAVRMRYADFEQLEKPRSGDLSTHL